MTNPFMADQQLNLIPSTSGPASDADFCTSELLYANKAFRCTKYDKFIIISSKIQLKDLSRDFFGDAFTNFYLEFLYGFF